MLGTLDNAMQWTDRDGNSEMLFNVSLFYCLL